MFLNTELQWTWSKYSIYMTCSLAAVLLETILQSSWRSRFIEHIHGNRSVKYWTVSLTSTETSWWCVWWSVNLRWWAVLAHVSPRENFQPLQHTDTYDTFLTYTEMKLLELYMRVWECFPSAFIGCFRVIIWVVFGSFSRRCNFSVSKQLSDILSSLCLLKTCVRLF